MYADGSSTGDGVELGGSSLRSFAGRIGAGDSYEMVDLITCFSGIGGADSLPKFLSIFPMLSSYWNGRDLEIEGYLYSLLRGAAKLGSLADGCGFVSFFGVPPVGLSLESIVLLVSSMRRCKSVLSSPSYPP